MNAVTYIKYGIDRKIFDQTSRCWAQEDFELYHSTRHERWTPIAIIFHKNRICILHPYSWIHLSKKGKPFVTKRHVRDKHLPIISKLVPRLINKLWTGDRPYKFILEHLNEVKTTYTCFEEYVLDQKL